MAEFMRRAEGLLVREVDGEVLVLDTAADRIHQLNSTASWIWRLFDSGATVPDIADSLANEFDLDKHKAEADVLETLCRFRQLNLVHYVESSPVAAGAESDQG